MTRRYDYSAFTPRAEDIAVIRETFAPGDPIALVGPICKSSRPRHPDRFIVTSGQGDTTRSTGVETAPGSSPAEQDEQRDALIAVMRSSGITVHVFDDELAMAQKACLLWPGEKARRLVADMMRERQVLPGIDTAIWVSEGTERGTSMVSGPDGATFEYREPAGVA